MDRTTDLETALSFVVRRIEEQAKTSGQPLNEEEHSLLKNLPSSNTSYPMGATEFGPAELVPRNINLERLCALAKATYLNDRKINPESLDWEFALAVFALNLHPLWDVLHSAGVKMYRRPLLDQLLVIIAGLSPVIAVILFARKGTETPFRWVGVLSLIYLASRQIEHRQLEKWLSGHQAPIGSNRRSCS